MTAWLLFFSFAFLGIVFSCLPGFLVFRSFRFSSQDSLALAPALSVFLYCVSGICLNILGIFATWVSMLIATGVVVGALIVAGCILMRAHSNELSVAVVGHSWSYLFIYLVAGIVITTFVFVRALDGPYSFCTSSDYSYHISLVRSFIDSGSYSTLHCSLYPEVIQSAGFYPAAWHVFSAILASLIGSVTMAGNITNFVVMAFVLPMGCYALLSRIFKKDSIALLCGSFLCLCFVGYPWILLIWGQLSSNLMSFALVPAFVALFWRLLESKSSCLSIVNLFTLLLCAGSITFAQTNGLFTAGVFCIPLIFRFASSKLRANKKLGLLLRISIYVGIAFVIVAAWVLAYKAPFLQGVVGVNRSYDLSFLQAIKNVLKLQFGSLSGSQLLLGAIVLVGLFVAITHSTYRPLALLYIGVAFIYIINDACVGEFQHFISGFWYNDYYRTGAMVALAAVPLACLALNALTDLFDNLFPKLKKPFVFVLAVACLLGNFLPLPSVFGLQLSEGMEALEASAANLYSMDFPEGITAEEWPFIAEVQEIVGDSLVLNISVDGSGFLYAYNGMNVYLRRIYPWPTTDESSYLADNLCNFATDAKVQEIVASLDAKYVLLLDANGAEDGGSVVSYMYDESYWQGILNITADTPGFKLILSQGDMRLYEIVA